jgi:RNA polymerase sigma-70 factor (ECF subfamily)
MMHQNDIQLINDILDGNVRSYSVLIERHKDLAFTIAYRILNNREDAEEVVQDAFVKAYRSLPAFRKDSRYSTWLFRIVYNAAISRKRSKKPGFQSLEDLSSLKEHYDPLEQADDRDEDRALLLERAMQQLPAEDNVLITLFYIHESSVDEIHSITGLTRSNIKVRLFRARKKLQKIIGLMTEKICI